MTEQEREEAFAKEISERCELLRRTEKWQGVNAAPAVILLNAVLILVQLFKRMYGEDAIERWFEIEEKGVFGLQKFYKLKNCEVNNAEKNRQDKSDGAKIEKIIVWEGA
jgi:hypothetical protein